MNNDSFTMYPNGQNENKVATDLIMKSKNGGFIDLENMNFESVVVSLDADFRHKNSSNVKLDFFCNLYYNVPMNGWLELVFSLYRYGEKENFELLSSTPYKIILSEELEEDETPDNIITEKNDFISFSYLDNDVLPGVYNYVVKAEINFINVESAQIQTSSLSLIAQ